MFESYQHYKGGVYLKLSEAMHTETEEMMVVYACAASGIVFCRPKTMFYEDVKSDDYSGPRFRRLPGDLRKADCKKLKWY